MLQVRRLAKIYKGKDGNDVHALRGIDISFPEKGMVFVLGKSGSGKSTLLNLLGGLDTPTSGTIVINGNEIATFSRRDLDSYRNQYVGFVFQEYNVLDDFSIFDNIELALRLQNQSGNEKIVANTLELVGLAGMEKRKANTLSGGQKQRVAIARAIVKNPEIVLADEPTGALDSATGAEVLDVLKKLSKDKLVVVVSHDREYALRYGDRIIEIADGQITHDTEGKETSSLRNITAGEDGSLCIEDCHALTEEEGALLLSSIKKHEGKAILTFGGSATVSFVAAEPQKEKEKPAETHDFSSESTPFEPKPNRLPMNTAFKMGVASLKKKPLRAALVCLLISLALGVFGIASSLMLYDTAFSIAATARSKNLDTENVRKTYECTTTAQLYSAASGAPVNNTSLDPEPTSSKMPAYFSVKEVDSLNARAGGLRFAGIYGTSLGSSEGALSFKFFGGTRRSYGKDFFGITDCGHDFLMQAGFRLEKGRYPTAPNEIAITRFTYDCYKGNRRYPVRVGDFIGKTLPFNINDGTLKTVYLTITGVYNTGDLPARYEIALDYRTDPRTVDELKQYLSASFHRLAYVAPSFYEAHGFSAKGGERYSNLVELACEGVSYGYGDPSSSSIAKFSPAEYVQKSGMPITIKDEAGNQIPFRIPGDEEVYLPKTYPEERNQTIAKEFATRSVYALAHYESSPYLRELLPETADLNAAKKATSRVSQYVVGTDYPSDHDYSEDVALVKKTGGKGYEESYYLTYLLSKARLFIAGYERENPEPPYLAGYEDFKNEVELAFANDPAHIGEESRAKIRSFLQENIGDYLAHQETVVMANRIADNSVPGLPDVSREDLFLGDAIAIKENPLLSKEQKGIEFRERVMSFRSIEPDAFGFIAHYGYDESNLITPIDENPTFRYQSNAIGGGEWKILGYYESADPKADISDYPIIGMSFLNKIGDYTGLVNTVVNSSPYIPEEDQKYDSLLCKTAYSKDEIAEMLEESPGYRYEMTNVAYVASKEIVERVNSLKFIFLAAGIGLGIFAVLMLLHFVSNSIASKTKQIGILRAVGARGSDLFKIFFTETGILLLACLAISISMGFLATWLFNMYLLNSIGVIVLEFGAVHSCILIGLTLSFAFLGTFFPVNSLARKAPIDSIREL